MPLEFKDLFAPVTDLGQGDALEAWRWLAGPGPKPMAMTALGDVFVRNDANEVHFLDTYEGKLKLSARTYDAWKKAITNETNIQNWFGPGLVADLRAAGKVLAAGQCYSPTVPLILGGQMVPENLEPTDWSVHLQILGQVYRKARDLPPGTPIGKIEIT